MEKREKKTEIKEKIKMVKPAAKTKEIVEPKRELIPEKTIEKEGFLWWGLRAGFFLMLLLFLLSFFVASVIIALFFIALLLFDLSASAIHLIKYNKKLFAVISLVVCVLIAAFCITGFILAANNPVV
jgi:uncharacterized metal-binding protein